MDFLGIGIVLVVLSGGVILKPTSLWSFIIAFAALAWDINYSIRAESTFKIYKYHHIFQFILVANTTLLLQLIVQRENLAL